MQAILFITYKYTECIFNFLEFYRTAYFWILSTLKSILYEDEFTRYLFYKSTHMLQSKCTVVKILILYWTLCNLSLRVERWKYNWPYILCGYGFSHITYLLPRKIYFCALWHYNWPNNFICLRFLSYNTLTSEKDLFLCRVNRCNWALSLHGM